MAMYDDFMKPCFAGMKADAGDDRVITMPAGGVIPFGVFVGRTGEGTVKAWGQADTGQLSILGIALHSHTVANKSGGYEECDAVSVMTRGSAWVAAADGVAADAFKIGGGVTMVNDKGEAAVSGGTSVSVAALIRDVKTVDGKTLLAVELK